MAKPLAVYGIKNCDTVKKALAWLDAHDIAYDFHDYKKEGADAALLHRAVKIHGWDTVINRKGTSWRALDEKTRASMTEKTALSAALENPSLIKRPMIVADKDIVLGFSADDYAARFMR